MTTAEMFVSSGIRWNYATVVGMNQVELQEIADHFGAELWCPQGGEPLGILMPDGSHSICTRIVPRDADVRDSVVYGRLAESQHKYATAYFSHDTQSWVFDHREAILIAAANAAINREFAAGTDGMRW